MSNISEQKALEAYPPEYEQEDFDKTWDTNEQYREPYIEGYDKAMQDFLEKAEKILTERMYFSDDEAKQFKKYMENEIQD